VFPDNEPVLGPVADWDAPQPVIEGTAPRGGAAGVSLQRIDRIIDGIQ